jgi:hypothetical protein
MVHISMLSSLGEQGKGKGVSLAYHIRHSAQESRWMDDLCKNIYKRPLRLVDFYNPLRFPIHAEESNDKTDPMSLIKQQLLRNMQIETAHYIIYKRYANSKEFTINLTATNPNADAKPAI